jgi:hypothetical protein
MTDSNMRTLGFLLTGLVAFVFLVQLASTGSIQAPALHQSSTIMAAGAPLFDKKASHLLEQIPSSTCNVALVNGGNYALATPTACKGARVTSMTIGVSAKSCAESTQADFRVLTNTTLFKGEFGFYLGQDKPARCLVVREIWGRTV